ncbi:MAG: hypothetical protein AAF213_09080 [Pseudomonadota bacterium]
MPKKIEIEFNSPGSHLGGMVVTAHGKRGRDEVYALPDVEKSNHGAPDTIQLVRGDMPNDHYWAVAHQLSDTLKKTPDHVNLREAEIKGSSSGVTFIHPKPNRQDWSFPRDTHSSRVLSGGANATIGSIERENTATVAVKSLRELRAMGAIDQTDYKSGLSQIAMAGLGEVKRPEDERHFKQGQEMVASYPTIPSVGRKAMPRDTVEFLATKPAAAQMDRSQAAPGQAEPDRSETAVRRMVM